MVNKQEWGNFVKEVIMEYRENGYNTEQIKQIMWNDREISNEVITIMIEETEQFQNPIFTDLDKKSNEIWM